LSLEHYLLIISFSYNAFVCGLICIIAGEYWLQDLQQVENATIASGGPPPVADAYTITDHPGPNYNCSTNGI